MRKTLKRAAAGLLAAAMAAGLAACGTSGSSTPASESTAGAATSEAAGEAIGQAAPATANTTASEEELVVAMTGEPTSMFFLDSTSVETALIVSNAISGRLLEII